jgi:hypothetical protein
MVHCESGADKIKRLVLKRHLCRIGLNELHLTETGFLILSLGFGLVLLQRGFGLLKHWGRQIQRSDGRHVRGQQSCERCRRKCANTQTQKWVASLSPFDVPPVPAHTSSTFRGGLGHSLDQSPSRIHPSVCCKSPTYFPAYMAL